MTETGKLEVADTRMLQASIVALDEAARALAAAQKTLERTRESIEGILHPAARAERGETQWFQESMP
jgi:hypothetical protein